MEKRQLRARAITRRGALNKRYLSTKSLSISERVYRLLRSLKPRNIASYYPYNSEPDPNLRLRNVALPKIKNGDMKMCLPKYGLKKGYRGIREPFSRYTVLPKRSIDAIIVPGVLFDRRGYRIGYGKGFYDRFLKNIKGVKIGVTFNCCLVERLNNEPHDVPVDIVITEKNHTICKLRRGL